MASLRIGFIGAGNMAQALAKGFISSGEPQLRLALLFMPLTSQSSPASLNALEAFRIVRHRDLPSLSLPSADSVPKQYKQQDTQTPTSERDALVFLVRGHGIVDRKANVRQWYSYHPDVNTLISHVH